MCWNLCIFEGADRVKELKNVMEAAEHFGRDVVSRYYAGVRGFTDEEAWYCLCPLDKEALCAETGYRLIPNSDPRFDYLNTAIEKVQR